MKQIVFALALMLAPLAGAATATIAQSGPHSETVYGDDNRKDLYDVTDLKLRAAADATAAIMSSSTLSPTTGGGYFIQSFKHGEYMDLCPSERFLEQPSAAYCTGFLVGPDLVATAGHCVLDETDCESASFVFHYSYADKNSSVDRAREEDVYRCKAVVKSKFTILFADYSLVKLDRAVNGIKPLELNKTGKLDAKARLAVIGHPDGMPLKIADGAAVKHDHKLRPFFYTNTDSFGGNSGSPVVNEDTGLVEGILVRGTRDYNYDKKNDCYVTRHCAQNGCRGERATRANRLAPYL